jgi:regulator of protease activity HflC (stomatin/prohibitin superfamily)
MNEIDGLKSLAMYLVFGGMFLTWLYTFIVVVKQKTAVIIEVFGKFSSVKKAGLNLKPPFPFGEVATTMNLQIMEISTNVGVKSKDNAFLQVPVKVQYQIINLKIKEAYYELDNPVSQMKSYIVNAVRSKGSELDMQELYSEKDSFEIDVKEGLTEKFEPFGYKIVNVLVDDPQPSQEIIDSYNRVLSAERDKEAAKNEAESLRIKLVGEAQAEKESLVLKGEAFKEYRAKIAEGNIEAMGLMLGTHELKEYTTAINGEVQTKYEYKLRSQKVETNLTHKDILDFFKTIDTNEALRDIGREESNTIILPANSNNSDDYSKIISMIESLKNN